MLGSILPHLLGISVGSLISDLLSAITSWVAAGAGALVTALGHALTATTKVPLGAGFTAEYQLVQHFGAALVALFLVLVVIQAIIGQDLQLLLRAAFIKLPAALLLSGVLVELVSLFLTVTDQLSSTLLAGASGGTHSFLRALALGLTTAAPGNPATAGFAGLFLAGLAAFVAFLLWIELVARSAALTVATLFLPLALSGIVWPSTAHWARRLGELIAALVLAKLVIAGVLALAVISLGGATGLPGVVEGIALLGLAAVAPFSLLRLVPLVEASAQLEGVARGGLRSGRAGASSSLEQLSNRLGGQEPDPVPEEIGFWPGSAPGEGPEFEQLVQEIQSGFYRDGFELLDTDTHSGEEPALDDER